MANLVLLRDILPRFIYVAYKRPNNIVFITIQGGLAGLAGQFPARYMGSLVQGQAVGGIITALINILSIEFSTDPSHSAFYCFLVAAIFIALDTVAFLAMNKSPFYKVNTFYNTIPFRISIL